MRHIPSPGRATARRWVATAAAAAAGASLLLAPTPAAQAQPGAKENGACTTLGQVAKVGNTSLICTKLSGRQIWQRVLLATPMGSTNGQWVKWDPKACTFVPAAAPKSGRYTAYMRRVPNTTVLGLGTQGEGVAIQDALNLGFKQAVATVGAQEVFANYRQSEGGAATILEGARAIALRRPNAVSSWAGIQSVLPAMMDVYKGVCTPVVQITFPVEGSISYGADNATVGRQQGTFLVDYLKEKNLSTGKVTAVGIRAPSLGADVNKRPDDCTATIKKALPNATVSNVEVASDQLSAAGAQVKMSDWFTANPASATGTVVICTIADIYAVGAGNAAKAAGRVGSVFASGVAGSADAVALIKAGDPVLVGSVDFRFQDWGKILVPLMLDSMEGLVVPRLSAPNVSMISAKTL